MSILIGTTSWTEKTLVESGRFYPPEVHTAEGRLRFYAGRFPIVEVDSTYYGLPAERNALLWAERTPDRFRFDIKAFRLLTHHQTPPDALPRDLRERLPPAKRNLYQKDLPAELLDELWARFRSALAPLHRAGKLGVVLFQFPPWFVYRPSHLQYLAECRERLPGYRLAVEFRTASWYGERHREETLDFERAHGLAHVVADAPQGVVDAIPAVWATTAEVAVVRLHGRNRENWRRRGLQSAAERFDYLYSEAELRQFVPHIARLAGEAAEVHVLFNNCHRDYAQRNAAQLGELMGQRWTG